MRPAAVAFVPTFGFDRASMESTRYDVTLSFAGEDRPRAAALAEALVQAGVRVFYDDHEKEVLWGKDLYQYLSDLYQRQARYCVVLVSEHYARKLWTRH